jgi:uncharacterized lipoprotein YajG
MAHRAFSSVFALAGLLLLAACGASPPAQSTAAAAESTASTAAAAPTQAGFPLTVTDDAGRDVAL